MTNIFEKKNGILNQMILLVDIESYFVYYVVIIDIRHYFRGIKSSVFVWIFIKNPERSTSLGDTFWRELMASFLILAER